MRALTRRLLFGQLDMLQTALVNHFDGWSRSTPPEIRGQVEALRVLISVGEPPIERNPEALADHIEGLIRDLPTEKDRLNARRLLLRRLKHPECGGNPQAVSVSAVHPKSAGWNASAMGPICAACGFARRSHDIDGQRRDCDGYVEQR